MQELIDELNLPIKASALCEFIVHKLKLTRKKKTIHAAERDRPELMVQREEWKEFAEKVDASKLVFLDESGVNTGLTRNYGRSLGKERVKGTVPFNRPVRTTVVSSIRLNGEYVHQVIEGAMNAKRYNKLLRQAGMTTPKPVNLRVNAVTLFTGVIMTIIGFIFLPEIADMIGANPK